MHHPCVSLRQLRLFLEEIRRSSMETAEADDEEDAVELVTKVDRRRFNSELHQETCVCVFCFLNHYFHLFRSITYYSIIFYNMFHVFYKLESGLGLLGA